jgi:tagatose-6-phosphate ketose/aldose isomerase
MAITSLLNYPLVDLDARGAAHTADEIAQQPEVWRQIAHGAAGSHAATAAFLDPILAREQIRIILTGAGSSGLAGQVLAPMLAPRLERRVEAVATTDLVSTPHSWLAEDVPTLLVSFARSGDSPESVAAAEVADQMLTECSHLVVTCNRTGRLAREMGSRSDAHVLILPEAANDRGFAMTSSFTGMILAAMLAFIPSGAELPVSRLAAAAEEVLAERGAAVRTLAERRPERLVFLGSGSLTALARESALKVLELTAGGIVTLAESPLGFRHGPKSVINDRTIVIVYLANHPYTRRYDLDIAAELLQTVSEENLVVVAATPDGVPDGVAVWDLPGLADADDAVLALAAVVYAQLIAISLSLSRGITPDNPFPHGEVNRVVQGVTVHPLTG